ncbi:MAG: dockerin type I domain-containing protein [Candidatus Bathyarchaeia archaeon]|jgi:uncharacterized protein (DUF2141 family)
MKTKILGVLFIAVLLVSFTTILVLADVASEPHGADAMWIEPSSVVFDTTNASLGQTFNITVWMNITENVFAYQVGLHYNRTQLKCTRAGYTAGATSQFFVGHTTNSPPAVIDTSSLGNGSVLGFETLSGSDQVTGPHSASLMWAEFQILIVPASGNLTSKFDITKETPDNNWVWDENLNTLTVTPYNANYAFIGPSGPPQLTVTISPTSASLVVNQTQVFTSNPAGGTQPYSFQWFINGTSASGATSSSFTFSEPTNGTYDVYLNVTDQDGTVAESNTAVVTVTLQAPPPQPGHDVAVVSVTPSASKVYKGGSINVNVTVVNNGTFNEVVNVTLYYNITAGQTIGIQTPNVNSGQYLTIIFTWNTSNVASAYPGYTIAAVANITDDNTPSDNSLSDGTVKVKILGDINGDGRVDTIDIVEAARAFGTMPGMSRWDANIDITQDGKIDGRDLVRVARYFGTSFS